MQQVTTLLLSVVAVVLEVNASPERRAIETRECSRVAVTVWEDADSSNIFWVVESLGDNEGCSLA